MQTAKIIFIISGEIFVFCNKYAMHHFMILCRHVNIGPQYQAVVTSLTGKFDVCL